jgi:uncharacterized protein YaeQ
MSSQILLTSPNLTVISIEQAFINKLASQLERSINWSITITEGTLYLTIAEETMEAAIQVKTGNLKNPAKQK